MGTVLMNLNEEQRAIVEDFDGARVCLAGPGSGKTTTMVHLIENLLNHNVPSKEIRAVTFSKEMATTLEKRVGVKGIVSTFHSLAYAICSEETRKPVEPELRHRLMMKLVKMWNLDYQELNLFLAKMKRAGIDPEAAKYSGEHDYGLCRAYAMYEETRKHEGWMDFDSMLREAVDALEKPEVRARWQKRYMIVDEAQDTDNLQWRMMQLLTERHGNISVVGDPGQAIYGFRGAMPENITDFQRWFPGGRVFYLGRNYRSTQRIVKFVRDNTPAEVPDELRDRMEAARQEKGAAIGVKMFWKIEDEAEEALALAQQDPVNSIILVRTNNIISVLERICNDPRHKVKYHLLGLTGFWKQGEIQKAIEAMKPFATSTTEAAMNMALPALERKYAVDDRTDRDNDALANLKILRTYAKEHPQAQDFLAYANRMAHRRNDARGALTISTVHQAKGGEWKNVYIIGADAKTFPHVKGNPAEEKRIWYVGVSRAIDYLRISFSGTPSPYLRRYLSNEILDMLAEKANEVQRLQASAGQGGLFA